MMRSIRSRVAEYWSCCSDLGLPLHRRSRLCQFERLMWTISACIDPSRRRGRSGICRCMRSITYKSLHQPRCKENVAHSICPQFTIFLSHVLSTIPLLAIHCRNTVVVVVTMPYQTRPSLPARCASLPPLHLDYPHPASKLFTIPEDDHFSWVDLPKEIQHRILRDALAMTSTSPTGAGPAWTYKNYCTHLRETILPLFLGLGRWDAYLEAASIFYHELCFSIGESNRKALLRLLSSPKSLRTRNFVHKLEIHFRLPFDLDLFDVESSNPSADIATALRSMRVHGQLRDMNLVLYRPDRMCLPYDFDPDFFSSTESEAIRFHLPMARLHIVNSVSSGVFSEITQNLSVAGPNAIQPGTTVIAPVYLASRAFQLGLLPLLERSAFQKSTLTLRLYSETPLGWAFRDEEIDGHSVFTHWIGATDLKDISEDRKWCLPRKRPGDLYPFVLDAEESLDSFDRGRDNQGDDTVADVATTEEFAFSSFGNGHIETSEDRVRHHYLLSSPSRLPQSSVDLVDPLINQELFEKLHSTIAETTARASFGGVELLSQDNILSVQEEKAVFDYRPASSCASGASSDESSSCVEAVSETVVATSDLADTVDTNITTDPIVGSDEKKMPDHKASSVSEPQYVVIGDASLKDHQHDVAYGITPKKMTMFRNINGVCTINPLPVDQDSNDGDNDSDTYSSTGTGIGLQSQGIEQPLVASSPACVVNDHLQGRDSDSESSEDSAQEFPPSRNAAFTKKLSGRSVPNPSKDVYNKLDESSDSLDSSDSSDDSEMSSSSSSSDEGDNPKSPTIDIAHHPGHPEVVDNGRLVMSGAIPSSDLSSSSSSDGNSGSEYSCDSDDSSSEEGKKLSQASSQAGKVFSTQANTEVDSTTIKQGKVFSLDAKRADDLSSASSSSSSPSSSADSSSDSDSSLDSDNHKADSDSPSSSSDDSDSSTNSSSSEDEKPCPHCSWRPDEPRPGQSSTSAQHKATISPKAPVKPAGRAPEPATIRAPYKPTAANKHQSQPTRSSVNTGGSNTPRSSNKRKDPPQPEDSTPLTRRQKRRRAYQKRKQARSQTV